jgi:hypothetical protein
VSEETFDAVLGTRQRWISGLGGIGLGFGVPFVLSVLLVATSGDPFFLILPLPFLGALWAAQGFAPSGYTLGDGGLILERRWFRRVLPYAAIVEIDRRRRPVGGLGAVVLNSLFGSHGLRWNPRTGRHYIFITRTSDLVWLTTSRGLIALSPERPADFTTRLAGRLGERGSTPSR